MTRDYGNQAFQVKAKGITSRKRGRHYLLSEKNNGLNRTLSEPSLPKDKFLLKNV